VPISYLTQVKLMSAVLVASTGSVESSAFPLQYVVSIEGIVVKASSVSSTADVKVEYVTSPDNVNYEAYADTQDITSSTLLDKAGNPEGANPFNMPPLIPSNGWIKFKVTGIASNPADTLVDLIMMVREGMH
jgi:hypothetical protein